MKNDDFVETDDSILEEIQCDQNGFESIPSEGKRITQTKSAYRQVRTLTILGAIAHLGAAPIPRKEFEELLYFVDCLLPAIGRRAWEGVGIKDKNNPLRPDWAKEIDWLVQQGLISIRRQSERKPIRRYCLLDISTEGRPIVNTSRNAIKEIEDVWQAAIDIGGAYIKAYLTARMKDDEKLIPYDEAFKDKHVPANGIIDYGEYSDINLSSDMARQLFDLISPASSPTHDSRLSPQIYLSCLINEIKS